MDKKINLADLKKENGRLRRQLVELDELPEKKGIGAVKRLKGVQDITTNVSKGIHSIPRQEDHSYLELYFLQKERERLVNEIASIKRRRRKLGKKLSHIDNEMAEKEESALQNMTMLVAESHEKAVAKKQEALNRHEYKGKEWSKLTLEY